MTVGRISQPKAMTAGGCIYVAVWNMKLLRTGHCYILMMNYEWSMVNDQSVYGYGTNAVAVDKLQVLGEEDAQQKLRAAIASRWLWGSCGDNSCGDNKYTQSVGFAFGTDELIGSDTKLQLKWLMTAKSQTFYQSTKLSNWTVKKEAICQLSYGCILTLDFT